MTVFLFVKQTRFCLNAGLALMFVILLGTGPAWGEEPITATTELREDLAAKVHDLEKRLDTLEKVEVIKKVSEFVCPDGEILDELPAGGRCPDGGKAEERVSYRKLKFSRREALSDKIAGVIEGYQKLKFGALGRGGLQPVLGIKGGEDRTFATGAVDLYFAAVPMPQSTFFVDFESIGGAGPDEVVDSLSRLNVDADALDTVRVREAWLLRKFISDRFHIVGGKIDMTAYFDRNAVANDETAAFLDGALVNNPMLKQPSNGPGAAFLWDPQRDLSVSFGVQSSDGESRNIGRKVFTLGEVGYHAYPLLSLATNLRLWGRHGYDPDDFAVQQWGGGVSLDQQVTPRLNLFARGGLGRIEQKDYRGWAWSTGFAFHAPWTSRVRDHFGMAYSAQNETAGVERISEAYYHVYLTQSFSVIANTQWLIRGAVNQRNIWVPGLRATISL